MKALLDDPRRYRSLCSATEGVDHLGERPMRGSIFQIPRIDLRPAI